jgi:hypothetical protein
VDVQLVEGLQVRLVSIVLQVRLPVGVICLLVNYVALGALLMHLQVLPALTVSLDSGQMPLVPQIAVLVLEEPTLGALEQIEWVCAPIVPLGCFLPLGLRHV